MLQPADEPGCQINTNDVLDRLIDAPNQKRHELTRLQERSGAVRDCYVTHYAVVVIVSRRRKVVHRKTNSPVRHVPIELEQVPSRAIRDPGHDQEDRSGVGVMSTRYKDFDQFFSEVEAGSARKKEPIRFTYAGEAYAAPSDMPAVLALQAMRLTREGDNVVMDQELVDILKGILGSEHAERLLASGITFHRLEEILKWLFAQYAEHGEDDGQGNAATPPEAAQT